MQANRTIRKEADQMVTVTQSLVDEFAQDGKQFFNYSGKVVNESNRVLKRAELVAHYLYGSLTGLHKVHENGNGYVFPAGTTLQPGQSIDFAYAHSYGEAQIFVLSYEFE